MSQALFGAGEHRLVITGLDVDHAIGCEADLRDRRREEVRTRQAPEHLARRPRSDAGHEQRGGGAVDRAIPAPGDFVKRTKLQPLRGQSVVQFAQPEGEDLPLAGCPSLDPVDLLPKARHDGHMTQAVVLPLNLFSVCSF